MVWMSRFMETSFSSVVQGPLGLTVDSARPSLCIVLDVHLVLPAVSTISSVANLDPRPSERLLP